MFRVKKGFLYKSCELFGRVSWIYLYNDNHAWDFDEIAKKKKKCSHSNAFHTVFAAWSVWMNKQKHKAFDKDEEKTKSDSAINMHKW